MVSKNIKEFENRWKKISSKVEGKSLDRGQAKSIAESFLDEVMVFGQYRKDKEKHGDLIQLMVEITNSLNVSLQIAVSNYERFAKPSWFEKIFGKPEVNIDINAIKNKF